MRTIRRSSLSYQTKEALRQLRYLQASDGRLTEYQNNSSPRLPTAGRGNTYYEYDVGRGRIDRGRARIVALFSPDGRLMSAYFTDSHYRSWMEIAW